MQSLLYDIRQQKPAINIQTGIFYNEIEGYTIKVEKEGKAKDDIDVLIDVMIYDHTERNGNRKVIIAEKGIMSTTPDQSYLTMELMNGYSVTTSRLIRTGRNKKISALSQFIRSRCHSN